MTPIALISGLLNRQIGLAVESIGQRAIEAAVNARMRALGLTDLGAYVVVLDERLTELTALIEEVVVPESWFLRDRLPFLELAAHARARRRAHPNETFRVLSVPCSTGEEPYSVAIALLEDGHQPGDFTIDAVDISSQSIERGRAGVYGPSSFRGVDPALINRWFDAPRGDTRALSPLVKRTVSFQQCNLLDPGFLVDAAPYHAVLCRNLLIYLTAQARRVALARLDKLLLPEGLLIAGHAEALEVMAPKYRALGAAGAFTYTRRAEAGAAKQEANRAPTRTKRARTYTPAPVARASGEKQGERKVVPPPEPIDLLAEAAARADRGDLASAAELCEQKLAADGDDAGAWTLLGTVQQARGELDDAERSFSSALYCDPAHYQALVQLALLLERRGDRAGAANMRRRAAKISGGGGAA